MNKIGFLLLFLITRFAWASGPSLTYHGRILRADGSAVTSTNVQFRIQLRSPGAENCLFYEETQTKDLSSTAGVFVLGINDGTGSRTDTSGISFGQVFSNRAAFAFGAGLCTSGNTYTPGSTDSRSLVVYFNDGTFSGWEEVPPQAVNFVPSAMESTEVGGFPASSLIRVADGAGPETATPLTPANFTELMNLVNGTSLQYMKSSASNGATLPSLGSAPSSPTAGQIWFDTGSNSIKYYNGATTQTLGTSAGNVLSVAVSSNLTVNGSAGGTITSAGTIDLADTGVTAGTYTKVTTDSKGRITAGTTLVESDIPTLSTAGKVSGSAINAGTIGGSAVINTSGNITTSGNVSAQNVSATGGSLRTLTLTNGSSQSLVLAPPSSITGSPSFYLPGTVGSNGQVLQTDGTGNLTWASLPAGLPPTGSASGDLSGSYPGPTVAKLQGTAVSGTSPVSGQFLKYGTNWAPAYINLSDLKSSVSGTLFSSPNCAANQTLSWASASDQFSCISIGSLNWSAITAGKPTTLAGFGITDGVQNAGGSPSVQTGVDASKPASPSAGAIYFATDTKIIYQYNSGAWVTISSASGSGGTITALTGDVSASGSGSVAATVNQVDGSSAANVHAAELLANAATNANTASAIVKRDVSGNFSAGAITLGTSAIFKDTGSNTAIVEAPSSITTSYTLALPAAQGSANQFMTNDGSGNLSWASLSSLGVASVAVTSPMTNSGSSSAPNIGIQVANTSQSGYLATADWNTFNGKQSTALTSGNLWVGNASNIAQSQTPGGDVSMTNAGSFTVAKIEGTSVSATAPTSAGQVLRYNGSTQYAPAFLGIADIRATITPFGGAFASAACTASQSLYYQSSTDTFQCQSLSVSASNFANQSQNAVFAGPSSGGAGAPSFRALAAADIPAGVATQWTTTGSNIYYNSGLVGIGNTSPAGLLDVSKALTQTVSAATGAYMSFAASTLTDSGTAASGTATGAMFNSIAAPTLTASNTSVTTTKAANLYIGGAPKAGTNEVLTATSALYIDATPVNPTGTATSSYGLFVNSQTGATNNYIASFLSSSAPYVGIGTATPTANLHLYNGHGGGIFGLDGTGSQTFQMMKSGTSYGSWVISNVTPGNNTLSASAIMTLQAGVGSAMIFNTNGATEQMRISSAGYLGVGNTTPGYKLDVGGDVNIAAANVLRFGGTSVCTSTGCTTSSDRRLKENIKPLENSLEKVTKLQGVEFDYKDKAKFTDKHQVGLIAQEIEKVYPEVVSTDSKTGFKAVAYDHLIAPVIEAIKALYSRMMSQDREIASVKAENAQIKAENAALKTRMDEADHAKDQKIKDLEQRLEKIEKTLNTK